MEPTPNTPPAQYPVPHTRITTRTKVALSLLIGPTALFIVTFILFAVANVIFGSAGIDGGFSTPSTATTITNVILFLIGAVSIMAWLPGIITGIVLLATQPQQHITPPQQ